MYHCVSLLAHVYRCDYSVVLKGSRPLCVHIAQVPTVCRPGIPSPSSLIAMALRLLGIHICCLASTSFGVADVVARTWDNSDDTGRRDWDWIVRVHHDDTCDGYPFASRCHVMDGDTVVLAVLDNQIEDAIRYFLDDDSFRSNGFRSVAQITRVFVPL